MKFIFATALSFFISLIANADTVLSYTTKLETGALNNNVLIKNNTVKSWITADQYLLFDTSTSRVLMVNTSAKSYYDLKPQDFNRAKLNADAQARVKESMDLVKKTLANLPEDQKKLVEQTLKDKLIAQGTIPKNTDKFDINTTLDSLYTSKLGNLKTKIPNITHTKTQQKKKVNGHDCEITEGFADNKKTVSLCLAPFASIGMPEKDGQTYQAFNLMMQKLGGVSNPQSNPQVAVSTINHGKKDMEQQLNKASYEELKAEEFSIPKDYKETKPFAAIK